MITDTQDTTGKILEERTVKNITVEEIYQAVASFEGEIMQTPPMYSALKVNGKKLYELAREGKEVERKAFTGEFRRTDFFDGSNLRKRHIYPHFVP